MTGRLWPSALAAALFAIHPLRAESVAWVTERKDVLSGLFFMLTLWAYVGYVRHRFSLVRYLGMMCLFALGLMAKPAVATLPAVLLLLDYWPLGRCVVEAAVGNRVRIRQSTADRRPASSPSRGLSSKRSPLLPLAAASCALRLWAQSEPGCLFRVHSLVLADRQRLAFVRDLPAPVLLSDWLGAVVSHADLQSPRMEDSGLLGSAGRHHGGRFGWLAEVSLCPGRLALVFGDAGVGDRGGAVRSRGDGRPLHLLAADRAVHCPGVGRGRPISIMAVSSLGVWRCRGIGAGNSDGVVVASNRVLVQQ